MATQLAFALSISESVAKQLRDGARLLEASEAERTSIDRLAANRGLSTDVDRLGPLALAVGLPWQEMWRGFL